MPNVSRKRASHRAMSMMAYHKMVGDVQLLCGSGVVV